VSPVHVDTGSFTNLTADVEHLVTDLAAMRGELADFAAQATTLRTLEQIRAETHAGLGSRTPRRTGHLRLVAGEGRP
jgi:hypothetical protein